MIPFTRQHVLRLEKAGKFPRRIQIGARRVGWLYTEIESWVAAKIDGRDLEVSADEVHDGLR